MYEFCGKCGATFASKGKLYAHQVLMREITVSPWEYKRVQSLSGYPTARKDTTYYITR